MMSILVIPAYLVCLFVAIIGFEAITVTNNEFDAEKEYIGYNIKNTKDAYNRGLAKNAKGYEDSQSMAIYYFDMNKKLLGDYGSVSEASKNLGITKTGILYQCKHNIKTTPRCGYYFRFKKEYDELGFVL
mgnify:CR=1 FL=1